MSVTPRCPDCGRLKHIHPSEIRVVSVAGEVLHEHAAFLCERCSTLFLAHRPRPSYVLEASAFRSNLFHLRRHFKISQQRMALILGLHQSAVSRIEKGEQTATPEHLVTLEMRFGVPMQALLSPGGFSQWLESVGLGARLEERGGTNVPLMNAHAS